MVSSLVIQDNGGSVQYRREALQQRPRSVAANFKHYMYTELTSTAQFFLKKDACEINARENDGEMIKYFGEREL